jgi:hypothetical protein
MGTHDEGQGQAHAVKSRCRHEALIMDTDHEH